MSRSTSTRNTTSTTSTPAPTREEAVRGRREITRYSFEYQRDRVSRKAGSSYFRVAGENGNGVEMTLQEAQSLYNFLGKMLNR